MRLRYSGSLQVDQFSSKQKINYLEFSTRPDHLPYRNLQKS